MELQLTLADSGVDAPFVAMKRLESIGGEIKIPPTHRVLAHQPVEIIHLGPYISVVVLQLQDIPPKSRQVDGDPSQTFGSAVFDTVPHRRLQRDDLRHLLVRAERQTYMDTLVMVNLQDLFYMSDIQETAGRDIPRRSDRCKPFGSSDDRQAV